MDGTNARVKYSCVPTKAIYLVKLGVVAVAVAVFRRSTGPSKGRFSSNVRTFQYTSQDLSAFGTPPLHDVGTI